MKILSNVLVAILLAITPCLSQPNFCGTIPERTTINEIFDQSSGFNRNLDLLKSLDIDIIRKSKSISDQDWTDFEVHEIPINAMILRKSDATGGILEDEIEKSIVRLNDRFKSFNMIFFVCNYSYIDNDIHFEHSFSSSRHPDYITKNNLETLYVEDAINVYFVPNSNGTSWSSFPWAEREHIVMYNRHVTEEENFGVLAHEIGHWFGLLHTFETARGVELVNGSNCNYAGDGICDTPADTKDNRYYYNRNGCIYTGNRRDPNNDPYNPMVTNVMSYYFSCLNDFTTEQEQVVQTSLLSTRRNVLTSTCQIPNLANLASLQGARVISGNFNEDNMEDLIVLRQETREGTIPIAFSRGDGSFDIGNTQAGDFPRWAASGRVKVIVGRFNSDNVDDLVLVRQQPGWETIPVALSRGDGSFDVSNNGVGAFAEWAAMEGVKVIVGRFNNDNMDDLVLIRQQPGWETIPVALSRGDGSFNITNIEIPNFPGWAATAGVKVVVGRFNNDNMDDLALVRQQGGWESIPMALSRGDGSFDVSNREAGAFAGWAATAGVKVVVGRFNDDNMDDLALVRQQPGWRTIPVAFSQGDGSFRGTNVEVPNFPGWAATAGVKVIVGKFNNDNIDDLVLIRQQPGWETIPVAFSQGDGSFKITNAEVPNFPGWASMDGVRVVLGRFNNDRRGDLLLVRNRPGWETIPIAFSRGDGSFDVTNKEAFAR